MASRENATLGRIVQVIAAAMLLAPNAALAQKAAAGQQAAQPQAQQTGEGQESNEKVDLSDLEKKYWAPKDKEFSVVQNRLYSKAGRFGVSLLAGPSINDSYSDGTYYGGAANYYFSERAGLQVEYEATNMNDNKGTQAFITQQGIFPNHNVIKSYYGASFNWIPIYAKLSLLDKKIIYFDMSFSPGVGMTNYEQILANPTDNKKSALTLSLDVAQQFFLSRNFAIRLDFKFRNYNQTVRDYRRGTEVETSNVNATTLLLGFTFLP